MRGAIKRLKEGFGFITGEDQHDYFFHKSGLTGTKAEQEATFHRLREGMAVTFQPEDGPKGLRAADVALRR